MATTLAVVGVGAALAAGGSAYSSNQKSKAQGKYLDSAQASADAASAQQDRALAKAELYNEIAEDRLWRAEQGRIGLFGNIGDIGTYEKSYEDFAAEGYGGSRYGTHKPGQGLFKKIHRSAEVGGEEVTATGYVLKPQKYVDYMKGTRQFRMMSYLTAEADQLVRREGPLWDEMEQSVLGPIYEGAAALQRQQMEVISSEIARGGDARRMGLGAAQKLRAAEEVNRQRTQATWQAKLALNQWARDNARTQLNFNMAWVDNQGGIRDSFNNAMTQISQFYGNTIMPAAINATNTNADRQISLAAQRAQVEQQRSNVGDIVSGIGTILVGSGLNSFGAGGGTAGLFSGGGTGVGASPPPGANPPTNAGAVTSFGAGTGGGARYGGIY